MTEVVQTIDVDTRWEEGIEHDPRSEEIVRWIADYDLKMYELDEYFAAKDKEKGQ